MVFVCAFRVFHTEIFATIPELYVYYIQIVFICFLCVRFSNGKRSEINAHHQRITLIVTERVRQLTVLFFHIRIYVSIFRALLRESCLLKHKLSCVSARKMISNILHS